MWGLRFIACAISVTAFALTVGCGGPPAPAESPEPAEAEPVAKAKPEPLVEKPEEKSDDSGEKTDGKGEEPKSGGAAEPAFKEGMSVNDAINAVPQGTPRVNIDQETLSKPLLDEALYKPCKLAPNQHFTLKVAIWDGKVVGIDVGATPKNDKVVACVKQQVASVTWRDKVKSLNTVEYQF